MESGDTGNTGEVEIPFTNAEQNIRLGDIVEFLTEQVKPPSTAKIAEALAKAQGEYEKLEKNRTVKVNNKAGDFIYSFNYGDLSAILKATGPALSENEIAVVQLPEMKDGIMTVTTRLLHSSGEELTGVISAPIAGEGKLTDIGKAMTYLRRYSLQAILNVAADDDTDASGDDMVIGDKEKPGKTVKGKMDKLGEQVRDILVALDNAEFYETLSDDWKTSFSHLLTNKNGSILDNDKWKDIAAVADHVNLIEMPQRKNISIGAKFISKAFKVWEDKTNV